MSNWRVYKGWKITFCPMAKPPKRYRASNESVIIYAHSKTAIRLKIDDTMRADKCD